MKEVNLMLLGVKTVINHKGDLIPASKSMMDGFKSIEFFGLPFDFYGGNAKFLSKCKGFSSQYLIINSNMDIIDIGVDLNDHESMSVKQLLKVAERFALVNAVKLDKSVKLKADIIKFLGLSETEPEEVDDNKENSEEVDPEKGPDANDSTDDYESKTFDELVAIVESRELEVDPDANIDEAYLIELLRKEDNKDA